MPRFIYLASQSPRRSQLLTQLGIEHELLLANAEEDAESLEEHFAGESPLVYVQRVTRLKLDAALKRLQMRGLPLAPVLCADTTVALGNTIYAKPVNADDAVRMLRALSGQTHVVLTAVAEDGSRLFRDDDIPMVGKLRVDIIQKMFNKAQELSGLSDADVDELGGASDEPEAGTASSLN